MSIDKLPDDCLLHIFNYFYEFTTLLNCSRVCERWKYLVLQRLSNVKYLTDFDEIERYPVNNTILYQIGDGSDLIDRSEWFPKLKIFESRTEYDCFADLAVEGLSIYFYGDPKRISYCNPSLKMLAMNDLHDFFDNDIQGPLLNQLYIEHCSISKFSKYAKHFPNLKRLHIDNTSLDSFEDAFYTGPVLEKLEILEIVCHSQWGDYDYYGFTLADQCPALKSAYHSIQRDDHFYVNSGIKNHFLEDLVLQFDISANPDWPVLRRVLYKYPNLKHLAIRERYSTKISHENVCEIVNEFPQITLIDIRNSRKVDENTRSYIDQFCKRHNRSISLHYQKRPIITKNWPHLSTRRTRIGRGLDFMKHCFLKGYIDLPHLLEPDE